MLTTKELPTNLTDKFWWGEGGPYHPWGETQYFLDGWAGLNVGMTPSWGRVSFWHERVAFQRSSFGRSHSGGRLLAMT